MTRSASAGGSHREMASCLPHPGTFMGLCCCRCPETTAGGQPAQKNFMRFCSRRISGIMKNHDTHLAPGFILNDLVPAPANVTVFWGLLGPGGFNRLYQTSFQQWNHFSRCGPREPPGPHSVPGDSPFPPDHRQVWSCGVADCTPLFAVLMEFKPSHFSFLLSPFLV